MEETVMLGENEIYSKKEGVGKESSLNSARPIITSLGLVQKQQTDRVFSAAPKPRSYIRLRHFRFLSLFLKKAFYITSLDFFS
jgi:hypothetical protein